MLGTARIVDAVARAEIVELVAAAGMLAARKRQRIDHAVARRRHEAAFLQLEIDEGHVEARVMRDQLRFVADKLEKGFGYFREFWFVFQKRFAQTVDRFGLLPSVHRVSVRPADDFLGWLGAYLLVPEVFGSAGGGANHQTERFTGADCADVMVGAFRRMGRTDVRYTNVAGLVRHTRVVAEPTVISERGQPERPIAAVQRGDLIRIDYGGAYAGRTPRTWDHVAALWEDRSDPNGPHRGAADGQLGGFAVVAHMGHPRLKI